MPLINEDEYVPSSSNSSAGDSDIDAMAIPDPFDAGLHFDFGEGIENDIDALTVPCPINTGLNINGGNQADGGAGTVHSAHDPFNAGLDLDCREFWTENGMDFVTTVLQQARNLTEAANATAAEARAFRRPPILDNYSAKKHQSARSSGSESDESYNGGERKIYKSQFSPPPSAGPSTIPTSATRQIESTEENLADEDNSKNTEASEEEKWIKETMPLTQTLQKYLKVLKEDLDNHPEEFYCSINLPQKKTKKNP